MKILLILICAHGIAAAQLPAEEGKDVTEKRCNSCHGPENYMGRPLSKNGWKK